MITVPQWEAQCCRSARSCVGPEGLSDTYIHVRILDRCFLQRITSNLRILGDELSYAGEPWRKTAAAPNQVQQIEVVWAPYKDAPAQFLGSHWTENPWKLQDPLERLYLTVVLGTSVDPPGGAGICGEVSMDQIYNVIHDSNTVPVLP